MFIPNVSCSCVFLNRLLSTTSGTSPRFRSMTTRMPDLSDSSWMCEMPSSFFSWISSAMRSSSVFLFTWYGSSSMMIDVRGLPLFSLRSSKCVFARITTRPRPVR